MSKFWLIIDSSGYVLEEKPRGKGMNGITEKFTNAVADLLSALLGAWESYRQPRQVVLQPVRSDDDRIFRA